MHLPTVAATGLLALAAFAPNPADAQRSPDRGGVRADTDYKALGTEPFWSLTIDSNTMRWDSPDRRSVTVPKPRPIVGFNGERYESRRMTVDITHVPCSDGMSDRRYRDTVTVKIDRRTWRGCGGALAQTNVPGFSLDGNWQVDRIADRPVARRANVSIRFDGQRVSGNTGCNGFGGTYKMRRGKLEIGPLMTTRRACIGADGAYERDLLQILGQPLSVSPVRGGKLSLTAPGGRSIVIDRPDNGEGRPGRR